MMTISDEDAGARAKDVLNSLAALALTPETHRAAAATLKLLHQRMELIPHELRQSATMKGIAGFAAVSAMYGFFISAWAEFDLTLELIIMRIAKIDGESNAIICGVLPSGQKMQVLMSLISHKSDDTKGIELLRKAQEVASRNILVHGFLDVNLARTDTLLYYREIKHVYTVKKKQADWKSMLNHLAEFAVAIKEVYSHFSISDKDLENYKKSISDLEPVHSSRATRHLQSKTNARKTRTRPPPTQ